MAKRIREEAEDFRRRVRRNFKGDELLLLDLPDEILVLIASFAPSATEPLGLTSKRLREVAYETLARTFHAAIRMAKERLQAWKGATAARLWHFIGPLHRICHATGGALTLENFFSCLPFYQALNEEEAKQMVDIFFLYNRDSHRGLRRGQSFWGLLIQFDAQVRLFFEDEMQVPVEEWVRTQQQFIHAVVMVWAESARWDVITWCLYFAQEWRDLRQDIPPDHSDSEELLVSAGEMMEFYLRMASALVVRVLLPDEEDPFDDRDLDTLEAFWWNLDDNANARLLLDEHGHSKSPSILGFLYPTTPLYAQHVLTERTNPETVLPALAALPTRETARDSEELFYPLETYSFPAFWAYLQEVYIRAETALSNKMEESLARAMGHWLGRPEGEDLLGLVPLGVGPVDPPLQILWTWLEQVPTPRAPDRVLYNLRELLNTRPEFVDAISTHYAIDGRPILDVTMPMEQQEFLHFFDFLLQVLALKAQEYQIEKSVLVAANSISSRLSQTIKWALLLRLLRQQNKGLKHRLNGVATVGVLMLVERDGPDENSVELILRGGDFGGGDEELFHALFARAHIAQPVAQWLRAAERLFQRLPPERQHHYLLRENTPLFQIDHLPQKYQRDAPKIVEARMRHFFYEIGMPVEAAWFEYRMRQFPAPVLFKLELVK